MSAPDPAATDSAVAPGGIPAGAAPRRRRRGRTALVVALIVLVLLVVGLIVAENLARARAVETVRERVSSSLGADPADVDVELGPGILLLQALAGRVDAVDIRIDDLAVGDLSGVATIAATEVPLSSREPVGGLDIELELPASQLVAVAGEFLDEQTLEVRVVDGAIESTASAGFFGQVFTIGKTFVPSVVDNRVVFTPTAFILGDQEIDPAGLANTPLASVAELLTHDHVICIADRLPESVRITDIEVGADSVVLSFDGAGSILTGEALAVKGTCS